MCFNFYHNISVAEYHQFFLNFSFLPISSPCICFHHSFSKEQLDCSGEKQNSNYTTSHFETVKWLPIGLGIKSKILNQSFRALEVLILLPSLVDLSPGCFLCFQVLFCLSITFPGVFCTCCSSPGGNPIMTDRLLTLT